MTDEYGCVCGKKRSPFCLVCNSAARRKPDFEDAFWRRWLNRLRADVATLVHLGKSGETQ